MNNLYADAFAELEHSVHTALETYSNVHRGSGHFSLVTTHLFEKARDIVLDYLGLDKSGYVVLFCSPRREKILIGSLGQKKYKSISSRDIGLPLGVTALAANKADLPRGNPFHSGGGTTKLVSRNWIIWADVPDRFEAGTPAVINIIAFAKALLITKKYGKEVFHNRSADNQEMADILYHDEFDELTGRDLLLKLRDSMIGRHISVPTVDGSSPYINLDNAASTSSLAPVWDSFRLTLKQPQKVQNEIINEVRSICSGLLNASDESYEIIFTSNTTEAINLVAEGLPDESDKNSEPVILNTLLEHNSNDLPWRAVPGYSLMRLQVDSEGFIDLKELEGILHSYNREQKHGRERIKLVAISGASNVLGSFNDLKEISRITHSYGARLLVDAAQLVAHRKVDIDNYGVDYFIFCAHKVYAPYGTGVLIARKGSLDFSSGEKELIRSSGEENAAGIAALGKALLLLKRIGLDYIMEEELKLTKKALNGLAQVKGITIYGINGIDSLRILQKGSVIAFSIKYVMPNTLAKELANRGGIGIRNGCHCAHLLVKKLVKIPPALEQFQKIIAILFPSVMFPGVARISMGIGNTDSDIEELIRIMKRITRQSKSSHPDQAASSAEEKSLFTVKQVEKQIDEFVKESEQRVYYKDI